MSIEWVEHRLGHASKRPSGALVANAARAPRAAHLLLRVVAGLLVFQHGAQKLFGWFGGAGGSGTAVELTSLMGLAGVLECLGGAAIVLGLFTRPVAFLLAGELAVAYFMAHQPRGAWPIENQGEVAVLFSFIFLFLSARGAGILSLDGLRHHDRA